MRAKKFGSDVSEDKKLARLIKFGAVNDQVWKISFYSLSLKRFIIFSNLFIYL